MLKSIFLSALTLLCLNVSGQTQAHHWNFEQNLNDQTGAGNGSSFYNISYTAGATGQGLQLSGDGRVDLGQQLNFDRDSAFTISLWVQPENLLGFQTLMSKRMLDAPGRGWHLGFLNDRLIFSMSHDEWISPSDQIMVQASNPFPEGGGLKHLVVSYDGSGRAAGVSFHVDTVEQAVQAVIDNLTGTTLNSTTATLGSDANDYCCGFPFVGVMDELHVFEGVLDAEQISCLNAFGVDCTAPAADPIVLRTEVDQTISVEAVTPNLANVQWRVLPADPATAGFTLTDETALIPSFTAHAPGTYQLLLTATNQGRALRQTFSVKVPEPAPADCRSCLEVQERNPGAASGVYTIDPDGNGPQAPMQVFCDMDMAGGGWTLVDTRTNYQSANHSQVNELTDAVTQNNNYLPADRWMALKASSSQIMITEPGAAQNLVIFNFEQLATGSCATLADDLAAAPLFHDEPGCSFTGSDYTYFSNPHQDRYFTTVTIYNRNFVPVERQGSYGETGTSQRFYSPLHVAVYVR